MANALLKVEITLSDEDSKRFEAYIEDKCLDREKYLKNLLHKNIQRILDFHENQVRF